MSTANPPARLGWSLGLGGTALLAAGLFRMTPPYRRRRSMTGRILPATTGPSFGQLVLGGGGFVVAALPLFWMGKLPADMPSSKDPGIDAHPDYARVARRGRIAGVAISILEIAWIIACAALS
ncbi:hypothetical protein GCM10010435_72140 [Winogradskya consettensis]|uniref:Uncharacterized protein n=1 Tax=Winogradskya consettensis TaxID=113560 RepID=A0A919T3F7_9ACTN|nr:hypothetical protein [Actinoplanes consettensis]GIM83535.1 hypothetical protein Aco04nite_87040 [Actinoplanes consettensis]